MLFILMSKFAKQYKNKRAQKSIVLLVAVTDHVSVHMDVCLSPFFV